MIKLFRAEGKEELLEDIDEMLSAIDNGEDINSFDVPERIKKESRVTERLLNFYVTLLGGFSTARGDSFYLRRYHPELLEHFAKENLSSLMGSETQLEYAGSMLYQYSKSLYYYHYIDGNIRSGKKRFSIPTKSENFDSTSNFAVLRLYNEGMIASFFQDLNPQDTKLTIKNSQVLSDFKERFSPQISQWLKQDSKGFLEQFYAPLLDQLPESESTLDLLSTQLKESDISHLKDSLYRLDFWLNYELLSKMQKIKLNKWYDKTILTSIFGTIRESYFGICLLICYLEETEKKKWTPEQSEYLRIMYLSDILGIKISRGGVILEMLIQTYSEFKAFLQVRSQLDDNEEFLSLVSKNIEKFLKKKKDEKSFKRFSGEDLIWFRGLLKNISYYNKRLIIPG